MFWVNVRRQRNPEINEVFFILGNCVSIILFTSNNSTQLKAIYFWSWFYKKMYLQCLAFTMSSFSVQGNIDWCLKVVVTEWIRTEFLCLVYSAKIMCGKMTCKVKPLISRDNFSAEVYYFIILYHLVERNSAKYNVSNVCESFSLWESKIKVYTWWYNDIWLIRYH